MTKQEAEREARALVRKLGAGWKTRVWKNLGWHFEAHLDDGTPFGRLRVFGEKGAWHALLNSDGSGPHGTIAWTPPWGPNPVAVARAAVALAKAESDSTQVLLGALPTSLK